MANTFNLGNGNWAQKTEKLLAYNAENNNYKPLPFDFDRASTATRVNKDGLIETVNIDEPRIDFLNNSKGHLLLEPERTNSILYSNGFDNSAWQKAGNGIALAPVVSANQGISPDGSNNAYKVDFDLNGGTTSTDRSRLTQNFTGTSSTEYVFTFYAKAYSASDIGKIVNFSVDNVSNEDANFTLTSEWQRFTFSGTSTGTAINQHIQLRGTYNTSDTASMLLFGYQAEAGSYATSYIPTSGSAVTRSAETCSGAGNEQVINSIEGVLYAEISALADDGSARAISLSDGTSINQIVMRYYSTLNSVAVFIRVGGTFYANLDATLTLTSFNKIAFKFKQNDFSLWINGTEVDTDTSGNTYTPNTLNELSFDRGDAQDDFYGKVKDVRVYNTALSDSELETLTTL